MTAIKESKTKQLIKKNTYKEKKHQLGFITALPKPSLQELSDFYEKKYFQKGMGSYELQYDDDELQYFKNTAKLADVTTKKHGLFKRSLIDLGCGEGFFSSYFQSKGWDVFCCDFSDFGLKKFNPSLSQCFKKGNALNFMKDNKKKYGLINFSNILEHVIDPIYFLNKATSLMDNESIVRCEIPNDDSKFQKFLLNQGYSQKKHWFLPPEHLSYFNNETISNVFRHCGLKIISMQTTFPIEIFIANKNSNYTLNPNLGEGAHRARVMCTNHLVSTDINTYIEYSESAAKLGFGRSLIVYAKKENKEKRFSDI